MAVKSRMIGVLENLTSPIVHPSVLGVTGGMPPASELSPNPGVGPNSEMTTKMAADHDLIAKVADVLVANFVKGPTQDPTEYAVQALINAVRALGGASQMTLISRAKASRNQVKVLEPGVLSTEYTFDNT